MAPERRLICLLALCALQAACSSDSEPGAAAGSAGQGASRSGGAGGSDDGGAGLGGGGGGAGQPLDASSDPLAGLEPCADAVIPLLLATKASLAAADSEAYVVPDQQALDALAEAIGAVIDGASKLATASAAQAGYAVCRSESVALFRPLDPKRGGASLAWRSGAARSVVLEAPHPLHDSGTLEQAVGLFDVLGARAIVVSGTHRCASSDPSPCSGTTEACTGASAKFRISDMAHTTSSFFHSAHVVLAARHPEAIVVGVHGMKDAGVSLSDGTTLATTSDSLVARLSSALDARFAGSTLASEPVTTCNPYPDAPAVVERLCGTTDVQGRQSNGSPDPCTSAASTASGRFVHLEQSPQVRENAALVADALNAALP